MHRKHIPLTEFDMMLLRAGWLPRNHMGEPKLRTLRTEPTLRCQVCRRFSRKLKSLAAGLDNYVLRTETA